MFSRFPAKKPVSVADYLRRRKAEWQIAPKFLPKEKKCLLLYLHKIYVFINHIAHNKRFINFIVSNLYQTALKMCKFSIREVLGEENHSNLASCEEETSKG